MAARAQIDWRRVRDVLDARLGGSRYSFADDPERTAAILRERTARLALVPSREDGRAAASFLVFTSGGTRFGLPLTALREVMPLTRIARVPGAAAAVRGVASWRGEFVTVFGVTDLLGIAPSAAAPPTRAALLRGEPQLALAFERAEGIGKFDISALHGAAEWHSRAPELFRGATPDAVVLFDASRLIARLREDLRAP